jgi:hypothetical protein
VDRIFADGRRIDNALRSAVREAIRDHQERNVPVVVWRNGRATLVSARELSRAAAPAKRKAARKRGRS